MVPGPSARKHCLYVEGAGEGTPIMKGLGHFPTSENLQEFLKYLLPVLDKIGAMESSMAPR